MIFFRVEISEAFGKVLDFVSNLAYRFYSSFCFLLFPLYAFRLFVWSVDRRSGTG